MGAMKRDPSQYYTHDGKLYGPGMPEGQRVEDLDAECPAKAEVMEAGPVRLDLTRGATADSMHERIGATGSVSETGQITPLPGSPSAHGILPAMPGLASESEGESEESAGKGKAKKK